MREHVTNNGAGMGGRYVVIIVKKNALNKIEEGFTPPYECMVFGTFSEALAVVTAFNNDDKRDTDGKWARGPFNFLQEDNEKICNN